jgi:hypothetical protein
VVSTTHHDIVLAWRAVQEGGGIDIERGGANVAIDDADGPAWRRVMSSTSLAVSCKAVEPQSGCWITCKCELFFLAAQEHSRGTCRSVPALPSR